MRSVAMSAPRPSVGACAVTAAASSAAARALPPRPALPRPVSVVASRPAPPAHPASTAGLVRGAGRARCASCDRPPSAVQHSSASARAAVFSALDAPRESRLRISKARWRPWRRGSSAPLACGASSSTCCHASVQSAEKDSMPPRKAMPATTEAIKFGLVSTPAGSRQELHRRDSPRNFLLSHCLPEKAVRGNDRRQETHALNASCTGVTAAVEIVQDSRTLRAIALASSCEQPSAIAVLYAKVAAAFMLAHDGSSTIASVVVVGTGDATALWRLQNPL